MDSLTIIVVMIFTAKIYIGHIIWMTQNFVKWIHLLYKVTQHKINYCHCKNSNTCSRSIYACRLINSSMHELISDENTNNDFSSLTHTVDQVWLHCMLLIKAKVLQCSVYMHTSRMLSLCISYCPARVQHTKYCKLHEGTCNNWANYSINFAKSFILTFLPYIIQKTFTYSFCYCRGKLVEWGYVLCHLHYLQPPIHDNNSGYEPVFVFVAPSRLQFLVQVWWETVGMAYCNAQSCAIWINGRLYNQFSCYQFLLLILPSLELVREMALLMQMKNN